MTSRKETSVGVKLQADLRNYQKGLNKAGKSTKRFGKETKQNLGSAKDAISRLVRGDITALPDLFKSSTAAAGGFSKGLKGVKAALIGTGIGAIIVALGTAIGALVSYFKNTEEGQIVFKKVMNKVKSYVEPVLQMFGKFGKALVQLFKGEFRGAWNTAKEAIKGVGTQIKANQKEVGRLNDMEEKYIKMKRATNLENKRLEAEIYEQRRIANDDENYSAQERARAIEKALESNKKLADNQRELAELELDIAKTKNSFGDNTIEDNDEIAEMEGKIFDIKKSQETMSMRLLRNQQRINKEVQTEVDKREALMNFKPDYDFDFSGPEISDEDLTDDLELDVGASTEIARGKLGTLKQELKSLEEKQSQAWTTEAFQKYQSEIDRTREKIAQFKGAQEEAMSQTEMIGEMGNQFGMLGNAIGGAAGKMLSFTGNFLKMIPQLISQIAALTTTQVASSQTIASAKGSEAIASGTAASQKVPFPLNLVALATTIASIIAALAKKPPKMASGGVAFGRTLAEVGEYSGARANPEVIAPLDKLKGMLPQGQSNQQPQAFIAETKLKGEDIYISYQRAQRRANKRT